MSNPQPLAIRLRALETYPVLGQLLLGFNNYVKNLPAWQVGASSIFVAALIIRLRQIIFHEIPIYQRTKSWAFKVARMFPFVQNQINKELSKTRKDMEKSMLKPPTNWSTNETLPASRMEHSDLVAVLQKLHDHEGVSDRCAAGKVSGTVYAGGTGFKEYTDMLNTATSLFAWTNPLHPSVFPAVRQMESEVIAMTCNIFNGSSTSCGVVTAGGTESICMALKAYRDYARDVRGITKPNLVAPRTAHPAFDKGCDYFGISLRKIQENPTTRAADLKAMRAACDSNTIALVGSCPQYPHGAVDPIEELGKLAKEYGCGMHVDCCLGSFLVPYMRKAGFEFPNFDFSVRGVTSISCDTHKYGMSPKGTSVLMYSNPKYRHAQYSVFPDWPGGIYGTPGIAGSRPGALIASTWAAMMSHGEEGYISNCKQIIGASRKIGDGIEGIPGLKLLCPPDVSVVAWTSDEFDINRLVTGLIEGKGWDLNVLQFPPAIHIGVTMAHTGEGIVEAFLADLAECTAELVANPSDKVSGGAALYGMAQAIPDRTVIGDIVKVYIDAMTVTTAGKMEKAITAA